jgi:hypothetical protein
LPRILFERLIFAAGEQKPILRLASKSQCPFQGSGDAQLSIGVCLDAEGLLPVWIRHQIKKAQA